MTLPADNFTARSTTGGRTLVDALLDEQRQLTAVEAFARAHDRHEMIEPHYRKLLPASAPRPGEQYAFEVNLDQCSGCKACVTACHSLNGLDDGEAWREVGALFGEALVPDSRSRRREEALTEMWRAVVSQTNRSTSGLAATGFQHSHAPQTPDARPYPPSPISYSLAASGSRVIPLQQTVTTACHHCVEPGCLEGCPVLAYDKDSLTGIVRHLDDQCIGCSYCILKCPYDVPKYSAARGIVRKCDMCHGRLAAGEAPACVQACPNEAIRISVVSQAAVVSEFRIANSKFRIDGAETDGVRRSDSSFDIQSSTFTWLPDSPSPRITLPTTRYVTRKPAADLRAVDHSQPRPQPAHWPLILMLVLTQAGIGGLLADLVPPSSGGAGVSPASVLQASRLEFPSPSGTLGRLLAAGPAAPLALVSLALLFAGLTASVFHLGQPLKAWRVWLGWRTSWLSREAMFLNAFAGVAAATVIAALLPQPHFLSPISYLLAPFGVAAVFAQAMVYADTHRAFWSLRHTAPRFFGSVVVLGLALALVATTPSPLRGLVSWGTTPFTGSAALHPWLHSAAPSELNSLTHAPPSSLEALIGATDSSHGWSVAEPVVHDDKSSPPRRGGGISTLALLLALATLLKLACELSVLKHADTDSDRWTQLRRTAVLQTGALRTVLGLRLLCALTGGVLLPFAFATNTVSPALADLAFALCLLGELAERYLFFTSVAPDKIPV